ncbi:hypothetical protein [Yeosuana marina]|uniref:hypothetical protein n=1 Tax=Yeosuana marina TaxID=1565536 RepID=UPI0030EC22B0|tara:strand:+ start:659 stop:1318 length:660 start_codon:yes stop_codon:yes gene_type:complete
MKTLKISMVLCTLGLLFTSCKDEKQEAAKLKVEEYATYVDSISNLDLAVANSNWTNIENGYTTYKYTANENIKDLKESEALKNDIDDSTLKFEDYKAQLAEKRHQDMLNAKNNLRLALLGKNYMNDDMKFEWINKDNILSVYQNFVDTVQANKDSYSREDWDEIKLIYEAIDTRKNTVENEGLTSSDNRKIAGLKLKFAPMYTFNRMGAKSEENAEAKE